MSEAPPSLDLRPDHWDIVRGILRRHVPGRKVLAFGSRATWTAKEYSDLDLAVLGDKPLPLDVASALAESFVESDLPFKVDVVDWASTSESFRKVIERDYVVLVDKETVCQNLDWHQTTLGELLQFSNGKKSPERIDDSPYPVYGSNGIIGFAHKTNSFPKTTVIGRVGSYCGSLYYSKDVCWVTDNAIKANAINGNNPKFLYYLLQTLRLNDWRAGSGQPLLNQTTLSSIPVAVPHLSEQRAIAHILGTLDDKIDLNRRMNETLEAMARALFKSWFVDFDPVRAKMEGRDTGLPKHIADLFPERLVESELGEIPEGWEVATVGDYVSNFDSKRVPVSGAERAKRKGPYPYHGAASVMDHVDDYLFYGVYLLLGEDGSVMRENGLAVTQYVWGKFWVNNHAHVLQGKGAVSTEQIYLHFFFEPIAPYVTGAVQPKLSQGRMNSVPFVFAGDKICKTFVKEVNGLFARLRTCAMEAKLLVALRDTLLPKLLSGELRVKSDRCLRL